MVSDLRGLGDLEGLDARDPYDRLESALEEEPSWNIVL
jgi:hypothetical protein